MGPTVAGPDAFRAFTQWLANRARADARSARVDTSATMPIHILVWLDANRKVTGPMKPRGEVDEPYSSDGHSSGHMLRWKGEALGEAVNALLTALRHPIWRKINSRKEQMLDAARNEELLSWSSRLRQTPPSSSLPRSYGRRMPVIKAIEGGKIEAYAAESLRPRAKTIEIPFNYDLEGADGEDLGFLVGYLNDPDPEDVEIKLQAERSKSKRKNRGRKKTGPKPGFEKVPFTYDFKDGDGRDWSHLLRYPGDPSVEDVRGWTPADREKIQNRVRARKKTVLSHIEAGDVEEYERKVLNKRANAIINPMPSASRAVGRVKETHAEAVTRRAALNIPDDATPAQRRNIMMKSTRERDKALQKAEWHEARRLHTSPKRGFTARTSGMAGVLAPSPLTEGPIKGHSRDSLTHAEAVVSSKAKVSKPHLTNMLMPRSSSPPPPGPTVLEARRQLQHTIFSSASNHDTTTSLSRRPGRQGQQDRTPPCGTVPIFCKVRSRPYGASIRTDASPRRRARHPAPPNGSVDLFKIYNAMGKRQGHSMTCCRLVNIAKKTGVPLSQACTMAQLSLASLEDEAQTLPVIDQLFATTRALAKLDSKLRGSDGVTLTQEDCKIASAAESLLDLDPAMSLDEASKILRPLIPAAASNPPVASVDAMLKRYRQALTILKLVESKAMSKTSFWCQPCRGLLVPPK